MTGSLARKLAVAVSAVIVIVDIALIGTAVRGASGSRSAVSSSAARTVAYPAPEMVVPTRPGASVRATPAPAAPARPAVVVPPRPSPSPAPTIEVLGESMTVEAEETPDPVAVVVPAAAADDAAGRALLAIGPDGLVLRATRGSCPADGSATVALSADFGRTWAPLAGDLAQVLGVEAASDGTLRVIATDRSCRPLERHSSDGGATWQAGPLAGLWYLSPDSESEQVLGPALLSDVGCVPHALAAAGRDRAAVACADGTVRVTDDAGDAWRQAPAVSGVVSLAFADGGYALARTGDCASAVLRARDWAGTWTRVACLDDLVPDGVPKTDRAFAAIAAAGPVLAAQIGPAFVISTDSGSTWTP